MRGSTRGQTLHLFNSSGINCIGQSKFKAKASARIALAAVGRSGTSTAIAEKTGIHSISSRDGYLEKWQEFGRFCKSEFNVKDIERLSAEHVSQFMSYKIEKGVSYSHWGGYAAALGKLENALTAYSATFNRGNTYNFRSAIKALRSEARSELPRFIGTRNYDNPTKLISAVANQKHQLVAKIQHESGLRIAGASSISAEQLRGLAKDIHTGRIVGLIDYLGKGGKPGTALVSPNTYQQIVEHISKYGHLTVNTDGYRLSLKNAAKLTGQDYNGSHGLRWNFAKERFAELQAQGAGYEKSLGVVSHELGHNRIEITTHYLGIK